MAGLRIGIPKAGKIHSASSQPLFRISLIAGKNTLEDEITGFISNLKISEPTRRIQGKNHYLFWDPDPQFCHRHGITLKSLASFALLEI
jgi:hypothetical protein